MTKTQKPWAGRFQEKTAESVERFTTSLHVDGRLFRYDIAGSIAHATMLSETGIISRKDASAIVRGLKSIGADMETGQFTGDPSDEDIHMVIEKELIRRIGAAGGKLHTARSRNDQIALDVRLFMRDEVGRVLELIRALQKCLVTIAKKEIRTVMPGYTHLQRAQPVLLSHYLLAFAEMFDRDAGRMRDCLSRINVMPLGAAALAGSGLPIDRARTAALLSFPDVTANSMDTVAARDHIAEFIFAAAMSMTHLSRFCEDLILWSTEEFGFVEISDAYTTGSSIMPQKKNPDIAELIRGKAARVYGDLMAIMTLQKGLPMTYNRDLQEDKEPLFDATDTVTACLSIFTEMLEHTTFKSDAMMKAAVGGFSTATDIAEYLVEKGVPFRDAHEIVGRIVAFCIQKKKTLPDLDLTTFRSFYPGFKTDITSRIRPEDSVNARKHRGGTARVAVMERIREFEKKLNKK